ncbi:MAG: glutathione S-transferase [Polyangiaceae bacterium]|nr:glutathione S-transferase [Polyangiaceae bacterium]
MTTAYRLITMGPSHFCEKARWALQRARVPFVEERHMPVFHMLATYRVRAKRSVPALVTDSGVLTDSTEILELADRHCGGRLYGTGATRKEAKQLEAGFERFGADTRRAIYFHVLDDGSKVLDVFGVGVSLPERLSARALFPLTRGLMRRSMRINDAATERSLMRIEGVFADVSRRLEGGRRYLVGEQLTAADLTFATLAAPILLPLTYGAPLPSVDEVPDALRELCLHYRETTAGQFVLRLYREERHRVLETAAS